MSPVKPAVLMLLLAIDDVSLPLRKNVTLHLSTPEVRTAPVLEPSPADSAAPDTMATHFYGTVLHDPGHAGGPFRMWYYACHRGMNPDLPARKKQQVAKKPKWVKDAADGYDLVQGPLCYAESDDGIEWRKPALGQVLFKGSRDNNALELPHTMVSGAAVIRDDADPDPARRYKMVYQFFPEQTDPVIPEYGERPTIACAVSPDGLRWQVTGMPYVGLFVEHCSFLRHRGAYIVHSQIYPGSTFTEGFTEGGGAGGRSGVAHLTYDFDRWPDLWQWALALPEPLDRSARAAFQDQPNFPSVHLGVGAASFGNVCVGVYGLWHDRKNFGEINCDLGLVVSNDGVRFREPGSSVGRPFIRWQDSPARAVADRPMPTILCQGNGILNVGDQTRIYHGRWRNAGIKAEDLMRHYRAEVALATLPRDRWGGLVLDPKAREGAVCSAPIPLPGEPFEILLNAEGCAGAKVELLDERLQPIAGFSGADAGSLAAGSGFDCPVVWPRGGLDRVGGRTARVLVTMRRPDDSAAAAVNPTLYAISLAARRDGR